MIVCFCVLVLIFIFLTTLGYKGYLKGYLNNCCCQRNLQSKPPENPPPYKFTQDVIVLDDEIANVEGEYTKLRRNLDKEGKRCSFDEKEDPEV